MRKPLLFLLIVLFTSSCTVLKTPLDSSFIKESMLSLDKAMIEKDTLRLNKLLHNKLTLGHSNNWVETKSSMLQSLINKEVIYTSIEQVGAVKIHFSTRKLITSRRDINVSGVVNANTFDVKLNVLEIWTYENKSWQLLARQSVNRKN